MTADDLNMGMEENATFGAAEDEFMQRMMFRGLTEEKVEVRGPCQRCEGRGTKGGAVCDVCDGDKYITQKMSLYTLARRIMPLIVYEMKKAMAEAPRGMTAGG